MSLSPPELLPRRLNVAPDAVVLLLQSPLLAFLLLTLVALLALLLGAIQHNLVVCRHLELVLEGPEARAVGQEELVDVRLVGIVCDVRILAQPPAGRGDRPRLARREVAGRLAPRAVLRVPIVLAIAVSGRAEIVVVARSTRAPLDLRRAAGWLGSPPVA